MFEQTIQLFDQYRMRFDKQSPEAFNQELGVEVQVRLNQLEYILEKVRSLEEQLANNRARHRTALTAHIDDLRRRGLDPWQVPAPQSTRRTKEEVAGARTIFLEMKLFTEMFYYIGGKVRTIVRSKRAPFVGLRNFECVGVRNIRNILLEHAEAQEAPILTQSFATGPHGPVLKAMRNPGEETVFPDAGLYPNAEEFRDELNCLLWRELAKPL